MVSRKKMWLLFPSMMFGLFVFHIITHMPIFVLYLSEKRSEFSHKKKIKNFLMILVLLVLFRKSLLRKQIMNKFTSRHTNFYSVSGS